MAMSPLNTLDTSPFKRALEAALGVQQFKSNKQNMEQQRDRSPLELALLQAQLDQAENPRYEPSSPFAKMFNDYQQFSNQADMSNPDDVQRLQLYEQALSGAAAGNQGETISVGADGNVQINRGGQAPGGSGFMSQKLLEGLQGMGVNPFVGQDVPEEMLKNPMFGMSRGGQGGVFQNPDTGETIYSPGTQTTAKLQNTLRGVSMAIPMLDDLIDLADAGAGFKGLTNEALGRYNEYLSEYTGHSFDAPANEALYEQSVTKLGETLMSGLGLPATEKALDAMFELVERKKNKESPKQYAKRLQKLKGDLQKIADLALTAGTEGFNREKLIESGVLPKSKNEEDIATWIRALPESIDKFDENNENDILYSQEDIIAEAKRRGFL